jgi:hypothetical protein
MKNAFTALIFTTVVLCCIAKGQQTTQVQEPEFNGIFFFLDAQTRELKPLEQQTPWGGGKIVLNAMQVVLALI